MLEYKLVLVRDVYIFEADGWELSDLRVMGQIDGGKCPSAWILRSIKGKGL